MKKLYDQLSDNFAEGFLSRRIRIVHKDEIVFTIRNFGRQTKKRARSFSTKEPETLAWIDSFGANDTLLDVGANIGLYSLYAAKRGHSVRAIEPDALNFALLNLNILDNHFNDLIIAYPYSIHSSSLASCLNIDGYVWGGALSSFDRNLDFTGQRRQQGSVFRQGSAGISIDEFVVGTSFSPNHIKIDVDGNELLVLEGACETLKASATRSVLIELFEGHPEFESSVDILTEAGFEIAAMTDAAKLAKRKPPFTANYIYRRAG